MKIMSFQDFLLENKAVLSHAVSSKLNSYQEVFDLLYYLLPDWKLSISDNGVVSAKKGDKDLYFTVIRTEDYRSVKHIEIDGKPMSSYLTLSFVRSILPEEVEIPYVDKKTTIALNLSEDYLKKIILKTNIVSNKKGLVRNPDEIKKLSGYEEMIKAGFVDITAPKSLARLNFAFGFPSAFRIGNHSKEIVDEKTPEYLCKFYIIQASGYLRSHQRGQRETPVLAFLDPVRQERNAKDKPYGAPGLAFVDDEAWNNAFKLLLEKSMDGITKLCKSVNEKPIFYPGPEKRGLITAAKTGIL